MCASIVISRLLTPHVLGVLAPPPRPRRCWPLHKLSCALSDWRVSLFLQRRLVTCRVASASGPVLLWHCRCKHPPARKTMAYQDADNGGSSAHTAQYHCLIKNCRRQREDKHHPRRRTSALLTLAIAVVIVANVLPLTCAEAITCDSGSLSNTCTISRTINIDSVADVSGTGNLHIQSTGQLTSTERLATLTIVLGGNLTVQGSVQAKQIEVSANYITVAANAYVSVSEARHSSSEVGDSILLGG